LSLMRPLGLLKEVTNSYIWITLADNLCNLGKLSNFLSLSSYEQLFNNAAVKHKHELKDLAAFRDHELPDLLDMSVDTLVDFLAFRADPYSDSLWLEYLDGTSILFYSYDAGCFHTWLLDKQGIQSYHRQNLSKQVITGTILNLRATLDISSVQRSQTPQPITHTSPPRGSLENVITLANDEISREQAIKTLSDLLLPLPIANKLDRTSHLIVVPILEIGTVPYAALQPFDDDTYLIDKMSISIASSLFDIGQLIRPLWLSNSNRPPLIVGNPHLPNNPDWLLPPLPGAETEAQAVATMLGSTPLLGREATKTAILSYVSSASLLYFATHGIANPQNPLADSFLMFSSEQLEQGWWTAREVQNTKLSADLAILSACQTGLGQAHDAGMIGLARAFQIAGVPRVVMSLWNVDDQATSELMQRFVQYLVDAENSIDYLIPSEALRQAMLDIKQNHPDPIKWAAFSLFGTPR
ncbi:CHAT domain-containing protein, partial [Leptothoe sp. PORK10 BA2]|uniref:CHAT domain-containing protein n=1 Tax=Leptothoe sp. PORK10 BA2 TaxID=3110254 RepID=UPI002B20F0FE